MAKGDIYETSFGNATAKFKVRGSPTKYGLPIEWIEGPLAGKPANIDKSLLKNFKKVKQDVVDDVQRTDSGPESGSSEADR